MSSIFLFLTVVQAIVAAALVAFVGLSIALAAVAVDASGGNDVSSTLDRNVAPADPLSTGADNGAVVAPPAGEPAADEDPLAAE